MATRAAKINAENCQDPTFHPQAGSHWSKKLVGCAEALQARLFANNYIAALDRPATRAEVLAIVHDIFGDNVPSLYASFDDAKDHIFEADVAYANLLEIVSGDTDATGNLVGTFRPDDAILRAEISKIIYEKVKDNTKRNVL